MEQVEGDGGEATPSQTVLLLDVQPLEEFLTSTCSTLMDCDSKTFHHALLPAETHVKLKQFIAEAHYPLLFIQKFSGARIYVPLWCHCHLISSCR